MYKTYPKKKRREGRRNMDTTIALKRGGSLIKQISQREIRQQSSDIEELFRAGNEFKKALDLSDDEFLKYIRSYK